MRDNSAREALLVRYLLGNLPEEEQVKIEDRAFQDQQFLQHIQAVESDLIDAYVGGELSEGERRQFESRFFASAERRRKVEFARALTRVTAEFAVIEDIRPVIAPAPITWPQTLGAFLRALRPAAKYSFAAAALLIVLSGSWLIAESLRLHAQVARLRAEQQLREQQQQALQQQITDEQARREELSAQLQQEREQREQSQQLVGELQREMEKSAAQPSQPAVVSLALWPGMSRGGGTRPKLALPQSARRVQLQIGVEPEDDYRSFRVELRAPGGQPVWTQNNLSARPARTGRAVILNLPANILKAGEYELVVKGVTGGGTAEDVGYHYFDVLKK